MAHGEVERSGQGVLIEPARRFLAAAKMERHGLLFELALTTGMRASEHSALKWPDFDPAAGTINVPRSLERLPGGGWQFADVIKKRSRARLAGLWIATT